MAASRDNQPCSPDVPAATDATSTAQRQNNTHVPFLDSKLTTLLRDSLGGNCHTVMLAALRRDGVPSVEADVRHEMYKQAVGCLNMATTAGKIVNRPVRNFTRTVESVVDNIPTIRVIESSCGITTM